VACLRAGTDAGWRRPAPLATGGCPGPGVRSPSQHSITAAIRFKSLKSNLASHRQKPGEELRRGRAGQHPLARGGGTCRRPPASIGTASAVQRAQVGDRGRSEQALNTQVRSHFRLVGLGWWGYVRSCRPAPLPHSTAPTLCNVDPGGEIGGRVIAWS
jgi:hypothetical protein